MTGVVMGRRITVLLFGTGQASEERQIRSSLLRVWAPDILAILI